MTSMAKHPGHTPPGRLFPGDGAALNVRVIVRAAFN